MTSLMFGEIVEPSTRALIDEDIDEYPAPIEILPVWEGNFEVPNEIDCLFITESAAVKDLVDSCVIEKENSLCKLKNGGVEIFSIPERQYMVVFQEEKELNVGEITEILDKWIQQAKIIYAITSESIHNYQNSLLFERPPFLIRILSNTDNDIKYAKLEQPNLITGLGSAVLSYCIHHSIKKCTLFVIYIDKSQQLSFNSTPILDVFKNTKLPVRNYVVKDKLSNTGNLYM
ncbi:uncharacterized protein LOC126891781 [Diabrotica virgifera virgifera]|uniref:Proteasome assembly chaperone 1 n=1 Tax=Diabrotica virgifera virgifera TaxID=50390 RepID=A0A6P7GQH6_DIAVI|nr:uncharacterized protein LOC126891781 [Diabrotica virgifera virgifera]